MRSHVGYGFRFFSESYLPSCCVFLRPSDFRQLLADRCLGARFGSRANTGNPGSRLGSSSKNGTRIAITVLVQYSVHGTPPRGL